MKPAPAMGLFLMTWRAEWARLSRAQLALAVSSQLRKPDAVTVSVVRKWESGQPPKSLEELEALCQVMRRHQVTETEVGQFRQEVYAACLDRQYEGLFGEEPVSPTAELGELALTEGMWNIVGFVARLHTLQQYVQEPPIGPTPRRLLRRWQEARCLLLKDITHLHQCARRYWPAVQANRQAGDILAESFGPQGLGGNMTVAGRRTFEAHVRAHDLREPGAADRMMALVLEFREQGDLHHFALSLPVAVWALADADTPNYAYTALERDIGWAAAYVADHCDAYDVAQNEFALCHALLAEGKLEQAARHLPLVEPISSHVPSIHPWSMGCFAYASDAYAEAQRHFERAHALSLQKYGDWVGDKAQEWLDKCERAQHDVRHRGKGRVVPSRQAGS